MQRIEPRSNQRRHLRGTRYFAFAFRGKSAKVSSFQGAILWYRYQAATMGKDSRKQPRKSQFFPASITSFALLLSRPIDIWMYHAHVSRQSVIARKALFFRTDVAVYFLLARIVDRILMSRKIVGSREDRVARLARRGINSVASMRPSLRVPCCEALGGTSGTC